METNEYRCPICESDDTEYVSADIERCNSCGYEGFFGEFEVDEDYYDEEDEELDLGDG